MCSFGFIEVQKEVELLAARELVVGAGKQIWKPQSDG